MNEKISTVPRLRAAPSPTGRKQLGNLRTFIYNYLYALGHGGQFILRIEDTDDERHVEGGVEGILEMFDRYGLSVDEDPIQGGPYAPYTQSERLDIYHEYAEKLIESGHAYRCFCTKERLDDLRAEQEANKQPTGYDGHCRDLGEAEVQAKLKAGNPHVIRMRFPREGYTEFKCLVNGDMRIKNSTIDDQIMIKSDGFPTYHFAVVIDDYLMKVTHVVRGREYLADTPKNIFIYDAFGWPIPEFVHVTHVLNPDGKGKLSTRHGAPYAVGYLRMGYLPDAVINAVTLLGWAPNDADKNEDDVYTVKELAQLFTFERLQKSNARFDPKKFDYIAGKHMRALSIDELHEHVIDWAKNTVLYEFKYDKAYGVEDWEAEIQSQIKRLLPLWEADEQKFKKALELVHERLVYFAELIKLLEFAYTDAFEWEDSDWKLTKRSKSEIADALESLAPKLEEIYQGGDPTHDVWEQIVRTHADELDWGHGELFMALRSAVTGRLQSPPLYESIELIGWDNAKKFTDDSLVWLRS